MIGLRSTDTAERIALATAGATIHDMRALDEEGTRPLLQEFLDRVAAMLIFSPLASHPPSARPSPAA